MEFTILNKIAGTVTILVSEEDADLASYRWSLSGGKPQRGEPPWYAHNPSFGYMHRVVAHRMGLIESVIDGRGGRWSKSVDHINGNKLDNQRSNLALKNRSEQMLNGNNPLRTDNTSGRRGVYYQAVSGNWIAYATRGKQYYYLGSHPTREGAIDARQAWDEKWLTR